MVRLYHVRFVPKRWHPPVRLAQELYEVAELKDLLLCIRRGYPYEQHVYLEERIAELLYDSTFEIRANDQFEIRVVDEMSMLVASVDQAIREHKEENRHAEKEW
jgi:hypothetical protein